MNLIYDAPEYSEKVIDKYLENLKSYNIVLKTEEAAASLLERINSQLNEESQTEILWQYEDLYLNLVERAQDYLKKSQTIGIQDPQHAMPMDLYSQNYNYYYGMNPYGNPYAGVPNPYGGYRGMGYGNYYYNGYYNQMFIRKAQDEQNEQDYPEQEYRVGRYGGKKRKIP